MTKIKQIGVMSAAKIEGLMGVAFGLVAGVFFTIVGTGASYMMGNYYGNGWGGRGMMSGGFGIFAIIIMPIMYGVFGFIAGAIVAWIYNIIAGWIGGLEIEMEESKEVKEKV